MQQEQKEPGNLVEDPEARSADGGDFRQRVSPAVRGQVGGRSGRSLRKTGRATLPIQKVQLQLI